MSSFKRLKELEEARQKQKEVRERLLKKMRTSSSNVMEQTTKAEELELNKSSNPPSLPQVIQKQSLPWRNIRYGTSHLQFFARAEGNLELKPQPWTLGLVNTLLDAANEGGVYICLVWPAYLDSIALLHGMASLERNFARDLRGMRTLLYPGTHNSRNGLHQALVNREQLSDLYRSLWVSMGDSHKIESETRSLSFEAILNALNDIRNNHPEVANPSLGELIPSFIYRVEYHNWVSVAKFPLERSLRKVDRLVHRRNIRDTVNAEWGDPNKAPGALMVLHHSARKDAWKEALSAPALRGESQPELLLLDATSGADRTSYSAVRRIPDFLRYALDNGYQDVGSVVITDDPKTFFVLRARLNKLKLNPRTRVWAAEGDETVLSTNAVPEDWKPKQRSNANFSVDIVDRDASQVAMAFQRLASETGNEDSPSHQAVMAACLYLLRLSNMPAGYMDLTAMTAEDDEEDFASQRNAWTPVRLGLQAVLQSGALNNRRTEADKAILKAETLIDAWTDATPMAATLLAEVQKHEIQGRERLSIVLPSKKYITLAHRFLRRKLGEQWEFVEARLNWHTLSSVHETLTDKHEDRYFIFVGVNRSVLRLLVTHPKIPHGTTVLITYKQADSLLTTLASMKEIEAFKPYRGRMGLLAQQLERRLKEIPNPLAIGKLRDMTMTFRLEDNNQRVAEGMQPYYRFELEGGGSIYSSGWMYRYEPDEDPFFRRVAASSIREGDFIFEMSDELRSKIESALMVNVDGLGSVIHPERTLLKLYHDDVKSRCDLLFKATKRRAMAREIHAKMVEMDKNAAACRQSRVYYWLALQAEGDTRPHAPKDAKFFKAFCKALQLGDEDAVNYWNCIRNARRLNQNLGRELSARYAEILFQPASAAVYRRVPASIIKQLQQQALHCIYRVERVVMPQDKTTV